MQSAEVAKKKLLAQGIAEDNIDILSGERLRVKDKEIRHPSFWRRLFGDDIDDDYATEYNRAIKTGGVLLTVRVDKDDADRIEALLDQQSTDYATFDTFDKRAAADIADGNHRHAAATTTAGATPTGTTAAGTVTGATGGAGVVTGGAGVVSGNTPGVVAKDVSLYHQHAGGK
ncbi:hypothetical protein [Biostraticola tofi]|uniref:hypothetical protein n=1 Tax=Biostraticola tofi TaxID=466109 RepID=UPI0010522A61|nr:hypothetical protein [Biostraticola tofi]